MNECFETSLQLPLGWKLFFHIQQHAGDIFLIQHFFYVGIIEGMRVAEFKQKKHDPVCLIVPDDSDDVFTPIRQSRMFCGADDSIKISFSYCHKWWSFFIDDAFKISRTCTEIIPDDNTSCIFNDIVNVRMAAKASGKDKPFDA